MRTEPIRIETDRVKKVRKYVECTRQTISGFIALAIDEKLKRESEGKECDYLGINPGDDTIAKRSAKTFSEAMFRL